MCNIIDRSSGQKCSSCALVPLAEGGAAVGAASLPQREAEEEAQGEEEDGTQDPQAGEVVLQDADSADKPHYSERSDSSLLRPAKKGTASCSFRASSRLGAPEGHFLLLKVSYLGSAADENRAFSVSQIDFYQTLNIRVPFFFFFPVTV